MDQNIRSGATRLVVASFCLSASTLASAQVTFGTNVVQNPGAEAGPASSDGTGIVTIPNWVRPVGSATVVPYGASGGAPGFPSPASPGPAERGSKFFTGGPSSIVTSLSQTINLSALASQIAAGTVEFNVSCWLGGSSTQDDNARLVVLWTDGNNNSVRTDTILGPSSADRGGQTGLLPYSRTGAVPTNVRSVTLSLIFNQVTGPYNNGYADNISVILTPTGPTCDSIDFNNDAIEQDPTDIEAFLSVYSGGPCVPPTQTCNDIDFNNDGIEQDPTDIEAFLSVYSGGPCL